MNVLEIIINNSNNLEKTFLDANFNSLECTTFVKDLKGKFLSCNDTMVAHYGCQKLSEVIGLTDHDFHPMDIVSVVRSNDTAVVSSGMYKIFNERFKSLDSKEYVVANSIKIPYKNSKNKIIGIMGFSIIHSLSLLQEKAMKEYDLSSRQLESLLLLVKGKPIKLIAETLSISNRTVEHYFETIKHKLKCANKTQLIGKALSIAYIKSLL